MSRNTLLSPKQRAYEYLIDCVRAVCSQGDSHLPPLKRLAQLTATAPATVRSALRDLERQGIVEVRPRHGVYVKTKQLNITVTADPSCAAGKRTKRDNLRAAIVKDLGRGVYPLGSLMPPPAETSQRYGVSIPTLYKVYQELIGEGLLQSAKRGCRVPLSTIARHRSLIAFVGLFQHADNIAELTPRSPDFWREIEQHAHNRNCGIITFSVEEFLAATAKDPRNSPLSQSIIGVVVLALGLRPKEYKSVCVRAGAMGVRLVCVDEIGDGRFGAHRSSSRILYLLMGCSAVSGRMVARQLLQSGHTAVAIIATITHGAAWLDNRVQGVQNAFTATGMQESPRIFSIQDTLSFRDFDSVLRTSSSMQALCAYGQSHRQPFGHCYESGWERFYGRELWQYLSEQQWYALMVPVFEMALRDQNTTVWICINDSIGLLALEFLKNRGKRDTISLIAFDDTNQARNAGLSSYNFNCHAVAHNALNFLITGRYSDPGPDAEYEGFVVVRSSMHPGRVDRATPASEQRSD